MEAELPQVRDVEDEVIEHIVSDARRRGGSPRAALSAALLELARRGSADAEAELARARSDLIERERQCERAREKLRVGMTKYMPEWCSKLELRARDAATRITYAQRRMVRARADADAWQVNLLQALRDFGPMLAEEDRERVRRERVEADRRSSDEQRALFR